MTEKLSTSESGVSGVKITWSGNFVSWYSGVSPNDQLDQLRCTYQVVALMVA